MATKQVKSKERVSAHGEVFTNEREVKAMCDLVKQETERIESRFLEPACGDGNFLAEVLRRKLSVVASRYGRRPDEYERYAVLALSSLYGVDILSDNAVECRQRLFLLWEDAYTKATKTKMDSQCCETVRYLLEKNILCGDALTMTQADGTPIIFAEWSFITGDRIKRRDFELSALSKGQNDQMDFSMVGWEYDKELDAFIPAPLREYPLISYRRIAEHG